MFGWTCMYRNSGRGGVRKVSFLSQQATRSAVCAKAEVWSRIYKAREWSESIFFNLTWDRRCCWFWCVFFFVCYHSSSYVRKKGHALWLFAMCMTGPL